MGLAASDTNGTIEFWMNDHSGDNSDWAASLVKRNSAATPVRVPTLDLSDFVERMHQHREPGGYRLMKMDIEGAEYQVLQPFLHKQLLCKKVLDKMTIEWHLWLVPEEARQAEFMDLVENGTT